MLQGTLSPKSEEVCEACHTHRAEVWVEADEGPPYHVCRAVAERVEKKALFPREWLNLSGAHGPCLRELGEEFYTFTGEPIQPQMKTAPPSSEKEFPPWDWFRGDARRTLGLALAWEGEDQSEEGGVLEELMASLPEGALRDELDRRMAEPKGDNLRANLLGIASRFLGALARPWLQTQWESIKSSDDLFDVVHASLGIVADVEVVQRTRPLIRQFEESAPERTRMVIELICRQAAPDLSVPLALEYLDNSAPSDLPLSALACLAEARDPRVLDRMERWLVSRHGGLTSVQDDPLSSNDNTFAQALVKTEWYKWGQLAAASRLRWPRLLNWLRGPTSLRLAGLGALLCLARLAPHQTIVKVAEMNLVIPPDPSAAAEARRELQSQRGRYTDKVVADAIDLVLKNWHKLQP